MITLLHGDDIVKSREELNRIRESSRGKEIRFVEGKTVEDRELTQALSSQSLFGGETLVIIENLFSGLGKKQKRVETLTKIIITESQTVDVILWEEKELGKTVISAFEKHSNAILFKLPTVLFQFLDSVHPTNFLVSLGLYRQLLQYEPPELVQALLIRRVRQLLLIKSQKASPELQPWQLSRLTNQARFFTMNGLLVLYKKLRDGELSIKTGTGIFPLEEATERLLTTMHVWQ